MWIIVGLLTTDPHSIANSIDVKEVKFQVLRKIHYWVIVDLSIGHEKTFVKDIKRQILN